ncbi:amino acid aminotransferase [Thermoplasma volcanium GSS1]|uniref:Aminotransferase n=1 Tax=Thermoplasma volcanium (strain ATCC 51530 / DSM 4299 / JCM 9571 / NBRC 15438 / GSS1) TaxID=273116 RepID=Q979X6_THEVO|nr:pyridoxal phosphate-dependent aminotransferase [Thermoplasma volcanium]BAB60176.1 amino acid aminotransferase [Thermoplasma volcanium GSS1]
MLSQRLQYVNESATVSASNYVEKLKKQGIKVYNFGIGEPDFTTPQHIIEYAFEMAKEGKTHYTPSNGIHELREKVSEKLKNRNNINASPDEVLITPTKFGINLAMMVILNPGDEVLIPEPYYVSYPDIVRLAGGKPVTVSTLEDYSLDFDLMRKYVTPKTKAIIFNNPTNPTGKVYDEKEIKSLVDFALEYGLYIVSDEIYEDLIYNGKLISPASYSEMWGKSITLNGFSKGYAMTGWRIGYMAAPREIVEAANVIQQQTITCVSSISQYAALRALDDTESPKKMKDEFKRRRDLILSILDSSDKLNVTEPDGAFYVFPEYNSDISSNKVSEDLLEKYQVVVTPGSAFGRQGEHHFRISFATSEDIIKEGAERIIKFFASV